MYHCETLESHHKDLVHDVSFNWYGNRLATCSSDQSVKIWEWNTDQQSWDCSASWKAHSGSVWKVNWAHPEFGNLIATCSFDRTAAVWEEMPGDSFLLSGTGAPPPSSHGNPNLRTEGDAPAQSHWVKKVTMVDSRTSVTDVKFAPKILGLILATCSADGTLRIYEASDVMNLTNWTLQHEIHTKLPSSSDDATTKGGKVFIYEYHEPSRRWENIETLTSVSDPVHDMAFSPNVGRSFSILGITSKELKIVTLKPKNRDALLSDNPNISERTPFESKYEVKLAGSFNDHKSTVWRICWNFTATILATSGDDGNVRLWKCNYKDNWHCVATLKGDGQSASIRNHPNMTLLKDQSFNNSGMGLNKANANTNANASSFTSGMWK
ncbi:hypothetical protein TCAL_05544 [Tigriopus californicus]|uniref:Nucleoporin SEH1 n=1 Tax=Tigriopus californicus TaxID=6832 RepID=A0A553P6S9_TIGCA|nr:hypothetical protein TCAL_05544 [Tigriopus californicus]|eukprot:TCALIF_05544-PA protein Name:"Similar to seh1l-a Nucleoporin seh1-A (Xenopus laevis)" AED:0.10 eAED:0.10 QI:298/0.66/0.5/1/1/1/4/166/380